MSGLDLDVIPKKYALAYSGLEILHDRTNGFIDVSMKDYYKKLLSVIPDDIKPRNTPGKPFDIKYGNKEKQTIELKPTIKLSDKQEKTIQKYIGMALWYRKVAVEVQFSLSKIASQVKSPNDDTLPFFEFLQGYFKMYGNHTKRFFASQMILHSFSDASFDNESKSLSRGGAILFLGNKQPNIINGPILCRTHILLGVPRSASEAEIEQEFDTGDLINQAKLILQAMGYPQQVNIILADNMTSIDFCKQSD